MQDGVVPYIYFIYTDRGLFGRHIVYTTGVCEFYVLMCVDCTHVIKQRCPALYEALTHLQNKAMKIDGCETSFTMFHMFMN